MQGFQNPAEQEKHLLAAQYFLIVEYYASYTERVKPGADGIILEMLPKINKKVGWLKVKSQRPPSVLKEVEMSRLLGGCTCVCLAQH